ncbi:helix-turn-helix transcriptional regulator [Streptomyces sp. NPDC005897]|uniref:helix-turn-helix domain-containing protein n=1 Tax=Streptomyces sp. NPDC005897 TaxID=3157081 RepID=UPI0033ED9E3A
MGNDYARLGTLVYERRVHLGLGVEPAAKLAGMSKDTWKKIEAGRSDVHATSYTKIERALQWAPNSCLRILEGHDPVVVEPTPASPDAEIAVIPKEELARQVGDSVNSAVLGVKSGMTAEEILALNERVLDELRKRGVI